MLPEKFTLADLIAHRDGCKPDPTLTEAQRAANARRKMVAPQASIFVLQGDDAETALFLNLLPAIAAAHDDMTAEVLEFRTFDPVDLEMVFKRRWYMCEPGVWTAAGPDE